MAKFQVRNLEYHTAKDPKLAETLRDLQDVINNLSRQTATVPLGQASPPGAPASLTVTSADGIFDIVIQDNGPAQTGISPDYFLEYSLTPSFNNPTPIYLGPTRTLRTTLGNQTLYWRSYAQYARASDPSGFTYFGGVANPTPVVGGGASSGPPPQAPTGSGTAPTVGYHGGSGFGKLPARNLE